MAENKEGPVKDPARPGESPGQKRPHATLDLKATEIGNPSAAEPDAGGGGLQKSSAEAVKPGKTAESSRATSSASLPSGAKTGTRPAEAGTAATDKPAQAPPLKPGAAAAPARRAGVASELGSVFTHLVAGLAGGLLVLLGAHWLGSDSTTPDFDPAAGLEDRLTSLEERLNSAPVAGLARKVSDVEGRLAALEGMRQSVGALGEAQAKLATEAKALAEKIAQQGAEPADRDRIAKLEGRLDALSAAAEGDPGKGGIAGLAAITGKITDLETSLASRLAAERKSMEQEIDGRLAQISEARETASAARTDASRLGQRVDALKSETERLAAALGAVEGNARALTSALGDLKVAVDAELKGIARPADVTAAVAPIAAKLAALEETLEGIVTNEAARRTNAERVVLSLELANLKRVLDRGQAYASELAEVKRAAGGRIDLAALERYKDRGVPTLADLERNFPPVVHAVLDAEAEPADASVFDRLIAGAKSVVRVRKVSHGVEDKSAEAVLGRMEGALKEDRLGDVIGHAKDLPPHASAPAEEWLKKVEARHAIDRALAALEDELKTSLSDRPRTPQDQSEMPAAAAGKDRKSGLPVR